jgi:hypothetical protein
MPNWKKIITSGSDAAFNTVIASNGFTGNLQGNADRATTAETADAVTSPLTQDLTINGTFIVNNGTYDVFNTSAPLLYDSTAGFSSLDWDKRQLFYPDGTSVAIDYSNIDNNLVIQNFYNDGGITISSSRTITLNSPQGVEIYNPYLFVPLGGLTSDAGNYLLTTNPQNSISSAPAQSFSKILSKNTSPITVSGTGNLISISSSLITSGLVETGSIIRITTRIIKTAAAGATTASIFYESPQSIPNSILLGQYIIPAGNFYAQIQRDLIVQNSGATTMYNASSSALTDITSSNAVLTTRNLNWGAFGDGGTRNISVYLSNLNSGDSSSAASLLIEKL